MIAPSVAPAPASAHPRRIDLHCHSDASNRATEVLLNAISCPECYSTPQQVAEQAARRGMDFVTITDHDSIDGVNVIAHAENVIVGEELTCWFPEDDCKMHVLVWGLSAGQHEHLQSIAKDVYAVAQYLNREQLAHAVAHPIYRQNDKLERWHVERLLLLFKGFECLNGAHSALHREAFEPLLDNLSRAGITRLSEKHNLQPLWPQPWIKARTGGSDDHGLLNVGRTWTEFPADAISREDILQCLRDGTCKPAGECGSSTKLAHTFYSVAVRYYSREILAPATAKRRGGANLPTSLMQMIVGEGVMPTRGQIVAGKVKGILTRAARRIAAPFRAPPPPTGTALLRQLFLDSVRRRIAEHPSLRGVISTGLPPLGEHEEMFAFVQSVNRDVTRGIAAAIGQSVDDASFTALFDAIASILAQQFVLLPYYFAVFHQNRERGHLHEITGRRRNIDAANLRVGLFTDTLDDVNGVSRFLRDLAAQAAREGRSMITHTCTDSPRGQMAGRKNFLPLLSRPMPFYDELKLHLPPVLEVLRWADQQQFDVIHVSTPGPMGLCGWLAAKMLRVPLIGTYHTDFPAYLRQYTSDHRAEQAAAAYMQWFCGQMAGVMTRSQGYIHSLRGIGVRSGRLHTLPPCVDTEQFHPQKRDLSIWSRHAISEPCRLLYCGRVSAEKNLPLLADAFRQLCSRRRGIALVIAGDGPFREKMRQQLSGLPVYFLGYQNDDALAALYASSDLLLFPSRTDTLGQVVMEAQASGLPAIVSNEGGPQEIVEDGITGLTLPATNPTVWAAAIHALLDDLPRLARMAAMAPRQVSKLTLAKTFDAFWTQHLAATEPRSSKKNVVADAMPV